MRRALKAAGRRLALAVPTLLAMTLVTYALARLAPGEPWWGDLDTQTVRASGGFEKGIVSGYAQWLRDGLRFEWGRSVVDRRLVADRIAEALPVTVGLSSASMLVAWAVAVPVGVWLGRNRRRALARAVSQGLLVLTGVPSAWLALLSVLVLAGEGGPFPAYGLRSATTAAPWLDVVWHAVLPVGCLSLGLAAVVARQMEPSMAEALEAPYSFAARARGIAERTVVWRHAFPNAALTMLTVLGMQLPLLAGGSAIIERAFGLPGMGVLALDALLARDYPVVMGVASVVALATVVVMALVDALVVAIDPRVADEGLR